MKAVFAAALLPVALAACAADPPPAAQEEDFTLPATAPLGADPKGKAAQYPVVLAHGFDGSPTNRWGWYKVADTLRADGHKVHVAQVPPYDSVEVRAAALAKHIDQALSETGAKKVNLLAHSMGGLDSRYVVAKLGYGDRVASVTTISTPHRGSPVADLALKILPGASDSAANDMLNHLASCWGLTYSAVAGDSHVRAAMAAISQSAAPAFNSAVANDGRVYYQSWAGVSSVAGIKNSKDVGACGSALGDFKRADFMDATLVGGASVVAGGLNLTPNDGMVTVDSAKWGTFRGCIPADHLDEVGQIKHDGRDKWTGLDHLRFYRTVAFELAAKGF